MPYNIIRIKKIIYLQLNASPTTTNKLAFIRSL